MGLFRLVVQEIRYRSLSFLLGVLCAAVAVGCSVAMLMLLEKHDRRSEMLVEAKRHAAEVMMEEHRQHTEQILADKRQEAEKAMRKLEDDFRKITLRMGFNMMILPKEQSLEALHAEPAAASGDPATRKYMPEEWALKLRDKKVATLNHLLPVLQQKQLWPERGRVVWLTGTNEEVYVQNPKQQKPLQEPVAAGTAVVGYALGRDLKLKKGDALSFMGRQFTIADVRPGRGGTDDAGLWLPLNDVQELLDKKGLISGILGLECECANERLAAIRREVGEILPETQVVEFSTLADARAESRYRVAEAAQLAVEQERQHQINVRGGLAETARASEQQERANQQNLRTERRASAKMLIALVLAACGLSIAMLTLMNVRQRSGEIGILRAIGLGSGQVLAIFLAKALLMGIAGACVGYFAGAIGATRWKDAGPVVDLRVIRGVWLGLSIGGAVLLAVLASLLPALLAAMQDPANLLREE